MKKILVISVMLIGLVGLLFADLQVPTQNKAIEMEPSGKVASTGSNSRESYGYFFSVEPTFIMNSYYDYQFGSYNQLPIIARKDFTQVADRILMTYFGTETADATRRQYHAEYTDGDVAFGTVSTNTIWEGYGSIDIDPETGDAFYAFHANDGGAKVDVWLGYHMEHLFDGLYADAFVVIDNDDPAHDYNTQGGDDEFIWPYLTVVDNGDGTRRVIIHANNATANATNPAENVLIAWADFTTDNLSNNNISELEWNYETIEQLNDWNDGNPWLRFFQSLADNGRELTFVGHAALGDGQDAATEHDFFAFKNTDAGVGDWEMFSTNITQVVENPQNQAGEDVFEVLDGEYLIMSPGNSGHFNAEYDDEGNIHFISNFGLQKYTAEGTSWFPYYQFIKHVKYMPATGEVRVYDLFPKGTYETDNWDNPEPSEELASDGNYYIPWDRDNNGEVDGYFEDGSIKSVNGFPIHWWGDEEVFHENKYHIYPAGPGELVALWQDATKAKFYNDADDEDYAAWASVPETMIAVSRDNGETWSETISLNSIDTPELDGMIPAYVYPTAEILDNENMRVHLLFLNDRSYGSSVQGQGDPAAGAEVYYAAIDIETVGNEPQAVIPAALSTKAYPNPFSQTNSRNGITIKYDMPRAGDLKVEVYNVKGQLVKTLFDGNQTAGTGKTLTWNGLDNNNSEVTSGVYFYKVEANGAVATNKVVVVK